LRLAKKHKCSIIKVPSNLHERFTFAYGFFPVLKFFENCHLIKDKRGVVFKIFETLNRNKSHLIRESKELALKLKNKYPLFYGTNYFYPVCYRMQTSIEEDAKIICHSNKITELFHNELEANPAQDFYPFLIIDKEESIKYKKQVSFFKKIIKGYFEFKFEKHSREERMFLLFYFTDFLGYYLSKLRKTHMGKTPLSDKIKKK